MSNGTDLHQQKGFKVSLEYVKLTGILNPATTKALKGHFARTTVKHSQNTEFIKHAHR